MLKCIVYACFNQCETIRSPYFNLTAGWRKLHLFFSLYTAYHRDWHQINELWQMEWVRSLHAQLSSNKAHIPSSGSDQVCPLVKQEVAVTERMTLNASITNYYWNYYKLLQYTISTLTWWQLYATLLQQMLFLLWWLGAVQRLYVCLFCCM